MLVPWTDDFSSALFPQLKMAFAGFLTDADINAAIAACKGNKKNNQGIKQSQHVMFINFLRFSKV